MAKIEIIIKVQENPLNKIRLGIRYDKKVDKVSKKGVFGRIYRWLDHYI